MFYLICLLINGWVNNGEAGDLWCHRAHCDVTVLFQLSIQVQIDAKFVLRKHYHTLKTIYFIEHTGRNMHYGEELNSNPYTKVPSWYWNMKSYAVDYHFINISYSLGQFSSGAWILTKFGVVWLSCSPASTWRIALVSLSFDKRWMSSMWILYNMDWWKQCIFLNTFFTIGFGDYTDSGGMI